MNRGEIWWVALPDPNGSAPGFKRPVLVVQSNEFNKSRINTVLAVAITSDSRLAAAPGNILLSVRNSRLPKESVINVSQVITLDKTFLAEKVHSLAPGLMDQVDEGLRLVLKL